MSEVATLESKLNSLVLKSNEIHQEFAPRSFGDKNTLKEDEEKSLCRVVSGVASTELLEELLISPLINNSKTQIRKDYYKSHALDEQRHYDLLSGYLKNTFNFVKTKKSFSDILFYTLLFPLFSTVFRKKPVYTLVLIYSFETLSIYFYNHVLEACKKRNLSSLVELIEQIKKDEMRHIAGIKTQMQIMAHEGEKLGFISYTFISTLLSFFLLDVSMSKWDFHNRKMRQRMQTLGIDTDVFTNELRQNKKDTMVELKKIFKA